MQNLRSIRGNGNEREPGARCVGVGGIAARYELLCFAKKSVDVNWPERPLGASMKAVYALWSRAFFPQCSYLTCKHPAVVCSAVQKSAATGQSKQRQNPSNRKKMKRLLACFLLHGCSVHHDRQCENGNRASRFLS